MILVYIYLISLAINFIALSIIYGLEEAKKNKNATWGDAMDTFAADLMDQDRAPPILVVGVLFAPIGVLLSIFYLFGVLIRNIFGKVRIRKCPKTITEKKLNQGH